MKKTLWLLMAASLAAASADDADLGPAALMSGSGTLRAGFTVKFAAYAIPGGKQASMYGEGGILDEPDVVHRFMVDPVTYTASGYDISVVGDAERGYYASFRPLTKTGMTDETGRAPRIVVPQFPPLTRVKDGDTIFLELMASRDGTQKIVDYIQIVRTRVAPDRGTATGDARDYSVDDGAVTFDTGLIGVWVDGAMENPQGFTGKPGATFWLSFPGNGRFLISLDPHSALPRNGTARDNTMAFEDSGHSYEIRFASPIAGAGKVWNLYVGRQAGYTPPDTARKVIRCGVDRLADLIAGR